MTQLLNFSMFGPVSLFGLLLLIPIIIIEALLLRIFLKKDWGELFKFCTIANLASLFAGLIFTFTVSFLLKMTSSFSAIITIIFALLSWLALLAIIIWIENKIYQINWKDIPRKKLLNSVIAANAIIYIIFLVFVFFSLGNTRCKSIERARHISCAANLYQIGTALMMYSSDNNGFFPDKGFEQLRSIGYLTDFNIYKCPSRDFQRGKKKESNNKVVDYVYQRGLKRNAKDAKKPLAWDKATNHKDYGNVLFVDGHVACFKGAGWMQQAGIKKKQ